MKTLKDYELETDGKTCKFCEQKDENGFGN